MSLIGYALRIAKQYYEPKTYDHALRVAMYVADNDTIPKNKMDLCISLGIMHDLIEDTSYSEFNNIPADLSYGLKIITKRRDENYIDYIKNIVANKKECPEAYYVKIADMKDHLIQQETLTDKLKEKYLAAIPYLL